MTSVTPLNCWRCKRDWQDLRSRKGGSESLDKAETEIEELAHEILKDPAPEQAHILPIWMYLTCIRVMHLRSDRGAVEFSTARADSELRSRCEKIPDAVLRIGYLNVPNIARS